MGVRGQAERPVPPPAWEQGVTSSEQEGPGLYWAQPVSSPGSALLCLPFPHRTLKGKLARQHPEAFSRKCHPERLHPTSGLCTL